jgi:SAM-dependent methyltransferase
MDQFLSSMLACPRDQTPLHREAGKLLCGQGHRFPIYADIPVLLLEDVEQTAWWAKTSIEQAKQNGLPQSVAPDEESVGIDPYVQQIIGATCGHLYGPLEGNLTEYPIPELRLPEGDGRVFLDIGCNWGRWSVAAARKGYRVIGIDPSLDAVIAAGRVAKQLNVDCSFAVGDARHLPFRSGTIDVAFSYSVIQHFSKENARAALQSIAEVLAQGGICFIQMPNRFGIRSLYHLARRRFAEGKEFDVRYYTIPELLRTFTSVFGNAEASVDGFFGLGIQPSDIHLLSRKHRIVVRASELLRNLSKFIPGLIYGADSVYIKSRFSPGGECRRANGCNASLAQPMNDDAIIRVEQHLKR